MLRRAFRTIRGRMMICYTCLIILATLTLSLIYYRNTARSLESQANEALLQLTVSNSSLLDTTIQDMDGTANRVISSELLKDAFYAETSSPALEFQNRRELIDLLFTINGSRITNQIHLLSASGKHVEFGAAFDVSYTNVSPTSACPWMSDCLEQEGRMFVVSPYVNTLGKKDRLVFSVSRAFNRTFGAPYDALVEVQMDFSDLESLIENSTQNSAVQLFIFNSQGVLIFPYTGSESVGKYYHSIPAGKNRGFFPISDDILSGLVAYCRSEYSGLTMVVYEDNSTLLAPLHTFRVRLVMVSVLLIFCSMLLSLVLSQQLTQPIRQIQHSINQLELSDLHLQDDDLLSHKSAYELDKLSRSYAQMVERLHLSLEDAVTARSQEAEARMQALQAQMSPHFLYNTITVISVKAEEAEDFEVVGMCECLTGMLRYVTRDNRLDVSLREELNYLQQYLYLMRCRYPRQFTVSIQVPEEMMELKVPKLVIQPLVENCFKHGFQTSAPWQVELLGTLDDSGWSISVTDNGVGLPEPVLEGLRLRFSETEGKFQSQPTEHVGLHNIFERLRFRYKERAIFNIENLPDGGCHVVIGGTLQNLSKEASTL